MTATLPSESNLPPATADPVLAALERIERRIADVERVASTLAPLVDVAPGGVAMLTDTFDTLAARLGDRGVDLDARMRAALRAVDLATAALAAPGDARPVGLWGLLKALRDPDVQRALGFLLAVARELGRHLAAGELEERRPDQLAAATEAP